MIKRFQHAASAQRRLVPSPRRAVALACGALALSALSGLAQAATAAPDAVQATASALKFDKGNYTTLNVTIDGQAVPVRWYKEVCYVAKPILMAATQGSTTIANPQCGYQSMNIFVPESVAGDQQTALYFAVNNGGWMASYVKASVTDGAIYDSSVSNVGAALKAGYVYIDLGSRSRGVVAADGSYPGKSPAAAVDAKAAVRYLRLNDASMPGSAERIVVNGTSGGGALSSILGASGNSADYIPYLAAVGAAGIDGKGQSTLRDDVFAINAYCPITDLGNADIAYEWLYTLLGTRQTVASDPAPESSATMAAQFAKYQRSLKLSDAKGRALSEATMLPAIEREVRRSAEIYMKTGGTIPDLGEEMTYTTGGRNGQPIVVNYYANDWIDVDNATAQVVSIDMESYLKFVATQATLKGVPSFDQVGVSTSAGGGESNLFGTAAQVYSNFTAFSWNHNDTAGDGVGFDDVGFKWAAYTRYPGVTVDDQVRLLDPMHYIGSGADTAPYWYVRHGTRDRDTAFTVSVNLSRALTADASVKDLDYRLAWNQPHAGNYDVPEAMKWIARSLKAAALQGR